MYLAVTYIMEVKHCELEVGGGRNAEELRCCAGIVSGIWRLQFWGQELGQKK